MAAGLREILGHLRQTLPPADGGLSDGQLLANFVAAHDESSFTALLRRHGGMVLGVARRVVGHAQDAEDVFQATFLVLARRAGSVCKLQSVGSWLYAVAYRPLQEAGIGRIETWAEALAVGEALPSVPLSLGADLCVPVDLESAYREACQRRRLDDVTS